MGRLDEKILLLWLLRVKTRKDTIIKEETVAQNKL